MKLAHRTCLSFFIFLFFYITTGRNVILCHAPVLPLGPLLCFSFSTALLHQVEVSWIMVNVKSTFIAVAVYFFPLTFIYIFITCYHRAFTLHLTVIRQG